MNFSYLLRSLHVLGLLRWAQTNHHFHPWVGHVFIPFIRKWSINSYLAFLHAMLPSSCHVSLRIFILLNGHHWWKISIALPLVALHKPIQISFKNKEWTLNQNYLCNGLSSWHLLVCMSILHTYWHISKRYSLSRVSIFFGLSSEPSSLFQRYPSQIF